MRKITFVFIGLLFAANGLLAQTYSTGFVTFFGGGTNTAYSGKVDVTSTTVTLTLIGPESSWLGVGFNAPNLMNDIGKDVVIYDVNNNLMTDRSFNGQGFIPPLDTQNWTVTSNTVTSGVRTVTATRSRVAAEGTDYTFPLSAQSLHLTFARGISTTIDYHGAGNCSSTITNLTLSTGSFDIKRSKIYPNPATDFVTIELPDSVYEADILIYDMQGRKVKETTITLESNKVDLTGLNGGSYLLNVKTVNGEGSKILVIN